MMLLLLLFDDGEEKGERARGVLVSKVGQKQRARKPHAVCPVHAVRGGSGEYDASKGQERT